jgi:hypothetical protein
MKLAALGKTIPGIPGILRQDEVAELRKGVIELRPYQDELLTQARKGNNVLVWLPTGTGKTYLVLKYAQVGGSFIAVCQNGFLFSYGLGIVPHNYHCRCHDINCIVIVIIIIFIIVIIIAIFLLLIRLIIMLLNVSDCRSTYKKARQQGWRLLCPECGWLDSSLRDSELSCQATSPISSAGKPVGRQGTGSPCQKFSKRKLNLPVARIILASSFLV